MKKWQEQKFERKVFCLRYKPAFFLDVQEERSVVVVLESYLLLDKIIKALTLYNILLKR